MKPKKRLIFTLLYDDGNFSLSRNFALQRVGDFNWLESNYGFSQNASGIDELVVMDVSRVGRDIKSFAETLKELGKTCFIPICAGGGVRSIEDANLLLRSGADKIILNTGSILDPLFAKSMASHFGNQCIVQSIDIRKDQDSRRFTIYTDNGQNSMGDLNLSGLISKLEPFIGELYLNSIDRDGTGFGYDMDFISELPDGFNRPLIIAGGAGKPQHLIDGLKNIRVDAVATAHLFNFIGDGLKQARIQARESGIDIPLWR
jgi:cyclase